jgi:hypothetical protein
MSQVDYATLQAIRKEAGFQHAKNGDKLTGVADGANKVFVTTKKPIVDTNFDGIVSAADVILYDDGVPVTVTAVNPTTGAITANVAPANASVMTADYYYSPLSDADIDDVRGEAQDWLNNRVKSHYDLADIKTDDDVPSQFRTIVKLYAAGLLLIRDYGSSTDTDQTSKDGYKKIDLARDLLKEFIGDITDDADQPTAARPVVHTDGNIFARSEDLGGDYADTSGDDAFFRSKD